MTRGQVISLLPSHPSGLLNTAEAAALVRVKPGTIRKWRSVGYLAPQGLDEHGYPLHSAEAVRAADIVVVYELAFPEMYVVSGIKTWEALMRGDDPDVAFARTQPAVEAFRLRSAWAHLYP